mmetsp:Transcript_23774/g.26024  ORF Transcript_23774/g.26024 Transcript_23774/m.26024 type:complete len:107 (+) Transcript_23774:101-421(+)
MASVEAKRRYCLNVTFYVKAERREEFLTVMKQNQEGAVKNEPLAILFDWGEDLNEPNTFHIQEQYRGQEGFVAHTQSTHFNIFKKFADDTNSPWTKPAGVFFFETD